MVTINISYGELADRLTILRIKKEYITEPAKLYYIEQELPIYERKWDVALLDMQIKGTDKEIEECKVLIEKLQHVNHILWKVEDDIRELEAKGQFDDRFIQLARAVYQNNDQRYILKQGIDQLMKSYIREQKSYK